tara:strand:+ start:29 stop:580 length:552 start_codon:yes stop_codon:yes gene_type:complete
MNKLLSIFLLVFLSACNKPKVVLICGDHVCVNNSEAEQFFEENLTLEVKLIDKKKFKETDLVQLNLKSNNDKKVINILPKKDTKQKLRILSDKEIKEKKAIIKNKKKFKDQNLRKVKKSKKKQEKPYKRKIKDTNNNIKVVNNLNNGIADICLILNKCDINEISQYLIKKGKNKQFPDITNRE